MAKQFKCGMYGGCFNPLHIGHIKCIEQAASMCDKLMLVICIGNKRAVPEIPEEIRVSWLNEAIKDLPNVHIVRIYDDYDDKHKLSEETWLEMAEVVKAAAAEPIDAVFHGSDYPEHSIWSKCYPGAKKVIGQRDEICSTEIRKDPMNHLDWMPPYVQTYYTARTD